MKNRKTQIHLFCWFFFRWHLLSSLILFLLLIFFFYQKKKKEAKCFVSAWLHCQWRELNFKDSLFFDPGFSSAVSFHFGFSIFDHSLHKCYDALHRLTKVFSLYIFFFGFINNRWTLALFETHYYWTAYRMYPRNLCFRKKTT